MTKAAIRAGPAPWLRAAAASTARALVLPCGVIAVAAATCLMQMAVPRVLVYLIDRLHA
jgi:hypothetical protein